MRLGAALEMLWRAICFVAGTLATLAAVFLAAVLPGAAILNRQEIVEHWPAFQWLVVLWLSAIALLNMLLFWSRLRRSNPDLCFAATEGHSVAAYLMSSRSAFRSLHGLAARIARNPDLPIAERLRAHAKFTRYLDIGCLCGWLSLVVTGVGIGLYAYLTRPI